MRAVSAALCSGSPGSGCGKVGWQRSRDGCLELEVAHDKVTGCIVLGPGELLVSIRVSEAPDLVESESGKPRALQLALEKAHPATAASIGRAEHAL
eukprot:scaffold254052_cov27-Tisochrysis_lutea.AAC.1